MKRPRSRSGSPGREAEGAAAASASAAASAPADVAVATPAAARRAAADEAAQLASAGVVAAAAAQLAVAGVAGAAELGGHPDAAAAASAAEEAAEFAKVHKNRIACLARLAALAQRIERVWDADRVLRLALLCAFRDALLSLEGHKDKQCAELAGLGEKMKRLDFDLHHFLAMALPIERQHTRGLRDHEFLVTRPDDLSRALPAARGAASARSGRADREPVASSAGPHPGADEVEHRRRMPLVLVLDNIRSSFNVGAIFRTADCLRAQKLYLCGYTATPEDAKGQTARAAMGAEAHVPWEHRPRALPVLAELRQAGLEVLALETVEDARPLHRHPFPAAGVALLVGNERHGLEADLLAACDRVVRIPCQSVKNSLNVGVAVGICGYEIARQWGWGSGA